MIKQALFEGKRYKYNILVANIVIAASLVVYVFASLLGVGHRTNKNSFSEVVASEYTADTSVTESADGMSGIYNMLINGTHADAGNGKVFYFGTEGIYSGYFDNQRTSVSNYSYEVVENESGVDCVNIYNPEKTQYVQYTLGFDENSNLVMFCDDESVTLVQ